MIDRQHNCIIWECDSCGDTFEWDEPDDFAQGWAAAKHDGWQAKSVGGEWTHSCPQCGVKHGR